MDLFDPKPGLAKWSGKPLPESLTSQLRLAFIQKNANVLASPRVFTPHGQSGIEYSDYIPHIGSCADDICLVRSMYTEAFNHHPGQLLLFTGSIQLGRPTMGAWALYGLGSESENLPGFVVLTSGVGTSGGASNFSSGFMPSHFQGTLLRNSGDPILYLSNPSGVDNKSQRAVLDAAADLNRIRMESTGDQEIASRIQSYELAYRMQSAAPELADLSSEPAHIRELYGLDKPDTRQFGANCLLARRLGLEFLDTGAMYRAVALKAIRAGAELGDAAGLTRIAEEASIELVAGGRVMLDGEDVSTLIRTPEIAQAASKVSAIRGVRRAMVASQRRMAESCSVVMEGRDIGTVVFPDAQVKIYLDASPGVRARRRVLEMRQKGMEADPAQVEAEIRERDHRDSNRAEAPLTQAAGAVYVDTSPMGVDEVVSTLLRIAGERIGKEVEA